MKKCSVCGQVKPPEEFPIDRRDKSGRAGRCTACNRVARRTSYRYRHRNLSTGYTPNPLHIEAARALRRLQPNNN